MPEEFAFRTQTGQLVDALRQSRDFLDYDAAFRETTSLPLALTSADQVRFALCSKHDHGRTSFCSMMVKDDRRCDTCRRLHEDIEEEMGFCLNAGLHDSGACELGITRKSPDVVSKLPKDFGNQPRTFECFAGLCETLVPIHVGQRLVAFLQTGQVLVNPPSKEVFRNAASRILEIGESRNLEALERAYFETPVVPAERYRAMVQLLKSYAAHLGELSTKLLLELESREPPSVSHAKQYIKDNFAGPLGLEDVALEVGVSPYHFSKVFKRSTGLKFTEYLSRVRMERAKALLLDHRYQIGQIAFEVGFQSLAPFNRTFLRFEGITPREYRRQFGVG